MSGGTKLIHIWCGHAPLLRQVEVYAIQGLVVFICLLSIYLAIYLIIYILLISERK